MLMTVHVDEDTEAEEADRDKRKDVVDDECAGELGVERSTSRDSRLHNELASRRHNIGDGEVGNERE